MTSPTQPAPDLSAYTGLWALDPDQTSIEFHTKAMWVFKVKGTAKATEGGGTVAPDGGLSGTFVVDAASFDTKNKRRDDHLRTADFFEVDTHPTITFTATGARPLASEQVEVAGNLAIHGQTKPLTVIADVSASGASATVAAVVDIDRSAWGLTWAKMGAGLANKVVIRAAFNKV